MPFFSECAKDTVLRRRKKTEEVFAATIFVGGAEMANGASFLTVGLFAAMEIVAGMGAGAGTPIRSLPE